MMQQPMATRCGSSHNPIVLWSLLAAVVFSTGDRVLSEESSAGTPAAAQRRGPPEGRGPGSGGGGRGRDASLQHDQEVFHFLLEHHDEIRREVQNLPNGVKTLTESDSPEVAAKIQEHVAAMHDRVRTGRGLRYWDDLFTEVFREHKQIEMLVENTDKGVQVTETSEDAWVVLLIQAHAVIVSKFVSRGFDEAQVDHPVPERPSSGDQKTSAVSELEYPIISGYGGVALIDKAVDRPQKGRKVLFEIRSADVVEESHLPNAGLVQVAELLNLYGATGLNAGDVQICVILQGKAVTIALSDSTGTHEQSESGTSNAGGSGNPNLALIRQLQAAGVELIVCGQSLHRLKISQDHVDSTIPVTASALTSVLNRQADGYTVVLVP